MIFIAKLLVVSLLLFIMVVPTVGMIMPGIGFREIWIALGIIGTILVPMILLIDLDGRIDKIMKKLGIEDRP